MGILAEEKGLVLQIQIDRKRLPEFVTGDELRLHQILTNLVNNAVKFTEHGSITIKVVLEKEDLENKHLVLHFDIIDTAIGIPTDKEESIFETFNQADNSIAG
jgi:signal transduction histidine kinase